MATKLGFYRFDHKAPIISNGGVDEITFHVLNSSGDTISGEFALVWYEFSKGIVIPKLEAFSDSWKALLKFPFLLEYLAKNDKKKLTPDDVVEFLLSKGVVETL